MAEIIPFYQRQILANQYRILEKLDPSTPYGTYAEIMEYWYTKFYSTVLNYEHQNEFSTEVQNETMDILDMFRVIERSLSNLNQVEKEKLDLSHMTFQGFDWNNDDHYSFLHFLIEVFGRYTDFKCLNSHSIATLPMYRRMLERFKSFQLNNGVLSLEQLQSIISTISIR